MLNPDSPLSKLILAPALAGRVDWIGLRPRRQAPVICVTQASLDPVEGLIGDHYKSRTGAKRGLTLIQAEHLSAIGAYLGQDQINPERLRRNVVISGLNLLSLKDRRFRLGSAVLEMTGDCHPCSRMEAELGTGGYNAMRGHGGITARVLEAGDFKLGDQLTPLSFSDHFAQ
jgi:MOSC domain-containing protein YiiM